MKRRTKIGIVIGSALIIGIALFARGGGASEVLQTDTVKQQDLERTILATGVVTSSVDLALAFKASGVVKRIPVKVGGKVVEGDILVQLDQNDQLASLAQARASVASANANLSKVLSGATNEEVQLAERAVDAARVSIDNAKRALEDTKKQQAVLVANARQSLFNNGLAAEPASGNVSTAAVVVSGAYTGSIEAAYQVKLLQTGGGWRYEVSGSSGMSGYISVGIPLPATNTGLYIQFSALPVSANDTWTINVPNTKATGYVAVLNAYTAALESQRSATSAGESAVASAEVSLAQAMASLNLKKAEARPADVAAARAQVLSAEAQFAAASSQVENTIIRAPSNGTITKIDIKVGEQAQALKAVVVLQDVGSLYVEANISEANIATIHPGQIVTYTFDALGPNKEFNGKITAVDPASTVVSGVVNYKVTASVENPSEVRPGMTANMGVLVGQAGNVLAVPQRALVIKDDAVFVRVMTDSKKQQYTEVPVTTGLEADGGLVEIRTGLSAGQNIVTFIETK